MSFLERYPPPWSWDDEETTVGPYVQIYCDEGTIAALYYKFEDEQAALHAFARFICDLVNRSQP